MKTLLKIIIASLVVIGCSCNKEKQLLKKLPPATQEGKNTIGCIINGEVYNTYNEPFNAITCYNWCQLYEGGLGGSRIMTGMCKTKTFGGIYIYIYTELEEGKTYQLGGGDGEGDVKVSKDTVPFDYYHTNDSTHTGTLTITKLTSGVMAGTFQFKVQGQFYPENTAIVTDGRFDLKRN